MKKWRGGWKKGNKKVWKDEIMIMTKRQKKSKFYNKLQENNFVWRGKKKEEVVNAERLGTKTLKEKKNSKRKRRVQSRGKEMRKFRKTKKT